MAKKKIIYAEFTRNCGYFQSAVHFDKNDGMWYLRKTDIFNRPIRYNPKEQILEVRINHSDWDVYEAYLYQVNGWDSNGNPVSIE